MDTVCERRLQKNMCTSRCDVMWCSCWETFLQKTVFPKWVLFSKLWLYLESSFLTSPSSSWWTLVHFDLRRRCNGFPQDMFYQNPRVDIPFSTGNRRYKVGPHQLQVYKSITPYISTYKVYSASYPFIFRHYRCQTYHSIYFTIRSGSTFPGPHSRMHRCR